MKSSKNFRLLPVLAEDGGEPVVIEGVAGGADWAVAGEYHSECGGNGEIAHPGAGARTTINPVAPPIAAVNSMQRVLRQPQKFLRTVSV